VLRVLSLPRFVAQVRDPVSELTIALDDIDHRRIDLFFSHQRANDCVESLMVTGLCQALNPLSESRLIAIGP
jgi:hypothetical protein